MANANTSVIERADRLFRMIVKERDVVCQRCLSVVPYDSLECHHFITRDRHATRFVLDNGVALCKWKCHPYLQTHPRENEAFAVERIGQERWDELCELSRLTKAVDYEAVVVELREQVAA